MHFKTCYTYAHNNLEFTENLMEQLLVGDTAPDFELLDHTGTMHRLSELLKTKNALLVFNIGFA